MVIKSLIFCQKFGRYFGSSEELSHIRMLDYLKLEWVRVNEDPAGLEPPAGARSSMKAIVKIRKKL